MSVSASMASASSVYHGPSSTIYASVGSVDLNEVVQVFAIEKNWFYIEYTTATGNKRGYVPYNSINNASTVASSVPTRSFTGYSDVPVQNVTVYMGPGTAFATSGSISVGEGITKFNETSGSYTYIEYSTTSKTKRGYVLTSLLANRNRGLLGTVNASSVTVYTGPDTLYVQGGGVYRDEYVVILETTIATSPAWFFIEFNSASGRKRGYVDQSTITPNSPLIVDSLRTIEGIATALQSLTVYSGPKSYYASVGSISANEMVSTIDGPSVESSYTFIEYNTTSGKKRGYVLASALGILPGSYATMLNASNVYHGPDSSNYAQVGSVSLNEGVQVLAKENNWFYIEYSTSSGNKRGYVPYNSINNAATIANNVPERIFEGSADVPNINSTVYMGPNTTYASSGTIILNEGITKFNETSGNFTYIEYSTSSGTKRGYILTTQLSNRDRGVLATVSATSASVYSGPDGVYFHSGGVFQGEYVVILERNTSSVYLDWWYYIEFNSASGRKRGYIKQELITPCSDVSPIESLRTGNGLALALQDLTVYSGPNLSFSTVGSIFTNERVSVLSGVSAESEYSYIEYNTGGSASKRGYVPTNALQSTSVSLPVISVPNVTEGIYGYSGNNRPLKYYKLGNGQNVLAAVFQVHGFEDAWAADGEELNKIAERLIQDLSVDNLPNWTVYVIPSANPDGLLDGWTNNGPGRATLSTANDINRSFLANFNAFFDSRNFTGSTSLASPEAQALEDKLLNWKPSSGTMILLDVHGWLNQSLGDFEVGQYYCNQFGFSNSSLETASGYLTRWGQLNGMLASLIELPFPSSPQDIITRDFAGKFVQATRNLLDDIASGIPVTGVTISPLSVTLNFGQTEQFIATVSPADATNKLVTWTSSNPSVATVDASGLVTAGTYVGTVNVTATTEDGSFSDSSSVTVSSSSIPVTGVTVSPTSVSLSLNETQQLVATVSPSNATNKEVMWSSSNTSIATVDGNGLVTAGTTDGNVTITATTVDGDFTATSTTSVSATIVDFLKYPTDPDGNWTMTLAWNGFSESGLNKGHMANDMVSSHKIVKAITNGTVQSVGWNDFNGNVVILQHSINSKAYYSFYAHLESISVSQGQSVTAGDQIGVMGGTPSFAPHLHLGIFVGTPTLGMYGYYRVGTDKAYFDDNGTGFIDYMGIRFYDPQKVFATDASVISSNYP